MSSKAQGKFFWLASYPKSGNTWTRLFIGNLLNANEEPLSINALETGSIASSRLWVQAAFDFDINELSHDEVDRLRPYAYEWLSNQSDEFGYHKSHDAFTYLDGDKSRPMFPVAATAGALLIVRNPLDVVISFAHHSQKSIDTVIERISHSDSKLAGKTNKGQTQLRQRLLTWSEFNRSWMQAPIEKKVIRYEDMIANPIRVFTEVAIFLRLPSDPDRVSRAVEQCRIETLQGQEKLHRFREKPITAKSFFRKGIAGDWKNTLSEKQVQTIVQAHYDLMLEMGYINENGEVI